MSSLELMRDTKRIICRSRTNFSQKTGLLKGEIPVQNKSSTQRRVKARQRVTLLVQTAGKLPQTMTRYASGSWKRANHTQRRSRLSTQLIRRSHSLSQPSQPITTHRRMWWSLRLCLALVEVTIWFRVKTQQSMCTLRSYLPSKMRLSRQVWARKLPLRELIINADTKVDISCSLVWLKVATC